MWCVCVGRVSALVGVLMCMLVHSDQHASSKLSALTAVCDSLCGIISNVSTDLGMLQAVFFLNTEK